MRNQSSFLFDAKIVGGRNMATLKGLTNKQVEQFTRDGILAVENFLTPEEVVSLKNGCSNLVNEMDPKEHRGVFSTTEHNQAKDSYFLDSGDKIRFFFETDSFDEDGDLKVPKQECLNKMGHMLHWLDSNFKKVTFSDKIKDVAESLGLVDPVVVQGMYIFKQPKLGTEVTPHQDGTFLNNDPLNLVGFWFPLDDATLENGCLWYVPGSHVQPVTRRFIRNPDKGENESHLVFKGEDQKMRPEEWVAAPVKKGSMVLIHGQVYHKSEKNTSSKPRHAYTFHMVETVGSKYSEKNWLQQTDEHSFPKLFAN